MDPTTIVSLVSAAVELAKLVEASVTRLIAAAQQIAEAQAAALSPEDRAKISAACDAALARWASLAPSASDTADDE